MACTIAFFKKKFLRIVSFEKQVIVILIINFILFLI